MEKTIQNAIADYLAAHRYLALASVDEDGRPVVHTMAYGSEGAIVYCSTNSVRFGVNPQVLSFPDLYYIQVPRGHSLQHIAYQPVTVRFLHRFLFHSGLKTMAGQKRSGSPCTQANYKGCPS